MKKLLSACGVLALAIGLVVAPGAVAKKGPKQVYGTVSVNVTPTSFTTGDTSVTEASVSGNVASNSNCRKFRHITFEWVDGAGVVLPSPLNPIAVETDTGPNGDFSATIPRPNVTNPPQTTPIYLRATAEFTVRKVGSKKKRKTKKGRAFHCMEISGLSGPVTILPAPAP
jgi:hypothetical protein